MSSTERSALYDGNCHCGAVRYTAKVSPPLSEGYEVYNCNCSICTKNGYLLCYPLRSDMKFTQGEDKLKQYRFGNKIRPHLFCGECGSSMMIDLNRPAPAEDRVAVNVRLFKDIDLKGLTYKEVDGKNELGPEYKV